MYERFTDRARRVVVRASEEARASNDTAVGTEYLLVCLIHEGDSIASQALVSLGVTVTAVREQIEKLQHRRGRIKEAPAPQHIPLTQGAKRVLEMSVREALQLGHNYVGCEHLLLGMIRSGDDDFVLSVPPDIPILEIRAEVLRRLGASPRVIAGTGIPVDPDRILRATLARYVGTQGLDDAVREVKAFIETLLQDDEFIATLRRDGKP